MGSRTSQQIDPPNRVLLGPGPSNIHSRVQMAMPVSYTHLTLPTTPYV